MTSENIPNRQSEPAASGVATIGEHHAKFTLRLLDGPDPASGENSLPISLPRDTVEYWADRIFHPNNGKSISPGWSVRIQFARRRETFNLRTLNATEAAEKATEIYAFLVANGWGRTLERYKCTGCPRLTETSIGAFLIAVEGRSALKATTVRHYAEQFRRLAAGIAGIESGPQKFDYVNGGAKAWRDRVHAQDLSILSIAAVNAWRKGYIERAGLDMLKRKSAERSAASVIRCSKALFSRDILMSLGADFPLANPFDGLRIRSPSSPRYRSKVDPAWLAAEAERELRGQQPQMFLAFSLCFWGGLRRKEADCLMWDQVDFEKRVIHIVRTSVFEPKTEESQRDIDLPPGAIEILRSSKKPDQKFVLGGGRARPGASFAYLRADAMWAALSQWLKSKGLTDQKPVHALRKESGSLIAQTYGIEAARQHLGHRDIQTTSAHYVTKKERYEVTVPGYYGPAGVVTVTT